MSDDIVQSTLTAPVGAGNGARIRGVAALFARLGCTAFGGPAAHVSVMEDEVVTRRGWLSRAEFLDLLAVVQLLPGPNSTELAVHIGQARAGWRGGIVAGLCFVLPSVVMVWVLTMLTASRGSQPVVHAVLWCLAPVVVVVLADALWRFGSQAWQRDAAAVVMPITALAAIWLPSDLLVLAIGAVLSLLLHGRRSVGHPLAMIGLLLGAGASVLMAQAETPAAGSDVTALLLYFLRAGASVFGSGYVLLAYLQRDLVDTRHWLSLDALTQASALAQITPGPLFATATAAGYMMGGHAGALAATVGIFAPAFLSVAVSSPLRRLMDRSTSARAALDGVVIASVALLGRAIVGFATPLDAPQWLGVGVASLLLFARWVQSTVLLLGAVVGGLVASAFHLLPP